jgi:hypothetical protein
VEKKFKGLNSNTKKQLLRSFGLAVTRKRDPIGANRSWQLIIKAKAKRIKNNEAVKCKQIQYGM